MSERTALSSSTTECIATSKTDIRYNLSRNEGEYEEDDLFILATDEVSRYIFLNQIPSGKTDWEQLLNLKSSIEFQTFIKNTGKDLSDDDDSFINIPAKSVFDRSVNNTHNTTIVKSSVENSPIQTLISQLESYNLSQNSSVISSLPNSTFFPFAPPIVSPAPSTGKPAWIPKPSPNPPTPVPSFATSAPSQPVTTGTISGNSKSKRAVFIAGLAAAGAVAAISVYKLLDWMQSPTSSVASPQDLFTHQEQIKGLTEIKSNFDTGFVRNLMDAGGQSRAWQAHFSDPEAAMHFFKNTLGNDYVDKVLATHNDVDLEQQLKILSDQIGQDTQGYYQHFDSLKHAKYGSTYQELTGIAAHDHAPQQLYDRASAHYQKAIEHLEQSQGQHSSSTMHESLNPTSPTKFAIAAKAVSRIGANMAVRHIATASMGSMGGAAVSCALLAYAAGSHVSRRVGEEYKKLYCDRQEDLTRQAIVQNFSSDILPVMKEVARGLPSDFKDHVTSKLDRTKQTVNSIIKLSQNLPEQAKQAQLSIEQLVQNYVSDPEKLQQDTSVFINKTIKQTQKMFEGLFKNHDSFDLISYSKQRFR
ncbi:hypothetical protein G7B40_030920 [Aetokthonos hydrillicola Thurmond2011]|jgi:hypothetical protein|uniref:Uncharacterized protein n=1 Tax=Aetokthonos hydrillicola Thurmond2011 TaxID=2712845 RepID=A0AAP5MC99_9CYAN|nr:hypothetical protein [Aetokthonos hydrillicola]MBW4589683.1 hypothetical protein [Aetokthonos hydrillicola CCALA 1050]MDR9898937.1 hypothetical protein [Aetokthonos hydrillicola Thurmond2011]